MNPFNICFYKNKNVFITGHTGFKGAWLCKMLLNAGANITGYALKPPTTPSLFELAKLQGKLHSVIGDIRNYAGLSQAFNEAKPEIVFHLAAQPIVRESYLNPAYTYETNVMGTVNILECVKNSSFVKSFLNVTTDKVYLNREWFYGYRENEELNGFDPYSNSKSCSELVTSSYKNSFLNARQIAASTARAGNVIGGGDFAKDRIIPDVIRAIQNNEPVILRSPHSIRPYQHVLEPIYAYLLIAAKQCESMSYSGCYNIGPDDGGCIQTITLADMLIKKWGANVKIVVKSELNAPHEANFLKLDCSKLKAVFGWKPRYTLETAVEKVAELGRRCLNNTGVEACLDKQINEFLNYA